MARWTGVRSGSDGIVELIISFDGVENYKGKYANTMALFDEGTPPPLAKR